MEEKIRQILKYLIYDLSQKVNILAEYVVMNRYQWK